jgi:cytochrome P450
MTEINRMEDPIIPTSVEDVTLFDPEIQECPFPTYDLLREEAPVFKDPITGMFVVTRYDDLRRIALDYDNFSNHRYSNDPERHTPSQQIAHKLFLEKGWVPGKSLAARDNPDHKQMRSLFDDAFRPKRIAEIEGDVEKLAYELIDDFIDHRECDYVQQYAVPLPLFIICRQMGAKDSDVWQIKKWTDAWIKGGTIGLDEEGIVWATEMEIQAQHYFQAIFEKLRVQPDETLLSDLVNNEVPGWGRSLSDSELHAEMMQDTFVGGSETTTNAMSAGIMLLDKHPAVWQKLKKDPEKHLSTFVEEVVRLESPVQGLTRLAKNDVEIEGVSIPKGSVIDIRYGAGNRDPRHFSCPHEVDIERKNSASHLGFSTGTHYCLGAPLARRELYWGFRAFIDRIDSFRVVPEKNNLRHLPNYSLRILKELHIEFTPK